MASRPHCLRSRWLRGPSLSRCGARCRPALCHRNPKVGHARAAAGCTSESARDPQLYLSSGFGLIPTGTDF